MLKEYLVLGEHKFEQARKANEGCKFYGKFSYLDLYEQAILHLLLLLNQGNWNNLTIPALAEHAAKFLNRSISDLKHQF